MGSSCTRYCDRTAHEYPIEECRTNGPVGMPGLASSSLLNPATAKVGGCPDLDSKRDANDAVVPPVPNFFQALQRDVHKQNLVTETPRFDEVQMTPRDSPQRSARTDGVAGSSVAAELRTPAASPRESALASEDRAPNTAADRSDPSYEGTFLGTMKHGALRLRQKGCTYDGDLMGDMKHGNGILQWDDGRQYWGQFEAGKFHGAAVMTWPDGRKYCGQYAEDRKHGEGTFSWEDGRCYKGQWVMGKRHGSAVYTNAKGVTRTGVWQMDRPVVWDAPSSMPAPVSKDREDQVHIHV